MPNCVRRSIGFAGLLVLFVVAFSSGDRTAFGSNGITIEAANIFTPCFGGGDLQYNIQNVDGFVNAMPPVGSTSWQQAVRFVDGDAWDRDWLDSDLLLNATDDITTDQPGITIAMYSGHGTCDMWSSQSCATSSQCTNPGPGQSTPGACTKLPGTQDVNPNWGQCMYFVPRSAVFCGNGDIAGHVANLSTGSARFGESPSSGAWGGAGTNGNTNFVIMDISCGATPGQQFREYASAFAGAHIISTIMPTVVGSDTLDTAIRGAALGHFYQVNPNASVAVSWVNAMSLVFGGTCGFIGQPGQSSPGHGISNCGAYVSIAAAESSAKTSFFIFGESWVSIQSEANDATGGMARRWTYQCNYDCSKYPIVY